MAILIWNMTINYWSPSSLFCDVMIVRILAHKNTLIHLESSQQIRIWWHANHLINSKHLQRFLVPSKWSLSLVHWGRLLIWQLSRRQSLTPFTRRISHKHSLPNKLNVHRVLYASMLTKLSGRKKCGRKSSSSSSSPLLSLVTSTSEISHQPVHTYTTYIYDKG